MHKRTVTLIRHPQTVAPAGVCYGATDLALAEDPALHAARLREILPRHYRLVSSPLQRCALLAQHLIPEPPLDTRLKEINFGAWEMQTFDSIGRATMDAWAADPFGFCPPGGESAGAMAARVLEFWNGWFAEHAQERALVVVAHAGPLRVLAGHLLGRPQSEWPGIGFDYARATCIELKGGVAKIAWADR